MGVAGAGKTTIGKRVAEKLNAVFLDGDDHHSEDSIRKMKAGIPLTDEERSRWIKGLNELLRKELKKGAKIILACSALKSAHRDMLSENVPLSFVYVKVDRDTAMRRSKGRRDHFFDSSLVDNQFQILEEPSDAAIIDGRASVATVLEEVCRVIGS